MAVSLVPLTTREDGFELRVYVQPNSKVMQWRGIYQGALKLSLQAPPINSAANKQLTKILSQLFDVSQQKVQIISGATSANKKVKITTEGVLPKTIRLILKDEC